MKQFSLLLALLVWSIDLPAAATRPNIIIILCDDMGYSDLGCYGSEIDTPNLDALAANGVRLTQFHNTAKCWTTRATLLTGKYWQKIAPKKIMSQQARTVAEVLRDGGYGTYMSGKWHLSGYDEKARPDMPPARGFEKFYGILRGATSFFDPDTLMREFTPIKAPRDGKYYFTDAISEDVARNIRVHADESPDKPFFMYVAYTAPHWPIQALPEDIEKYRDTYKIGWEELRRRRFAKMKKLGVVPKNSRLSPPNQKVKDWNSVDQKWEAHRMAVYAAMIDRMDQGIGHIVAALKSAKTFDNTLIMFMSDNGGSPENIGRGNGVNCLGGKAETREGKTIQVGYGPGIYPGPEETFQGYGPSWANASCTPFTWWKTMSHEGGVATPFIAHWPRGIREPGKINPRDFAHLIDLMPTCLDAAKVAYPKKHDGHVLAPLDGVSMLPTLTVAKPMPQRIVFNEFANKAFVRDGDRKLVTKSVPSGEWELYNLRNDPTELSNLAPTEPARLERMKQLYIDWYTGMGREMPKKKTKQRK